jgi:hypothetical protein
MQRSDLCQFDLPLDYTCRDTVESEKFEILKPTFVLIFQSATNGKKISEICCFTEHHRTDLYLRNLRYFWILRSVKL